MQVGSLTAFLAYLVQILMAVMMATFMATMIPRASVSADRIGEVLDTDDLVAEPTDPVHRHPPRSELSSTSVDFHYPGAEAPVLQDVTFTAAPGA